MDDLARKRAALMDADDQASVREVADQLYCIPLPDTYSTLGRPTNCYVVDGPAPALINAGHPAQQPALMAGLEKIGVRPEAVERVIATSWRLDILGGAMAFPQADRFICSPDMVTPRDYEAYLETRRKRWDGAAQALATHNDEFDGELVGQAIADYFVATTRDLRFIPLSNGHILRAGELSLEVLRCGGPGPGHMALYDSERGILFSGDLALSGLPDRLDDTQAYLVSMERLAKLPSEQVFPNQGRDYRQGRWTVARAANFINNFLSNAPSALVRQPTVLEFVMRDQGLDASEPVELLKACQRFESLLEELVRARKIAAEGEGAGRRYGVDVDDPRDQVRKSGEKPA